MLWNCSDGVALSERFVVRRGEAFSHPVPACVDPLRHGVHLVQFEASGQALSCIRPVGAVR